MADRPAETAADPSLPEWLRWARQLAALAQEGLAWSTGEFDRERYGRLAALADEIARRPEAGGETGAELDPFFSFDPGHPTPKLDVRAVVTDNNRVLLVRERSDRRWALPGGWAEVGLTAAEVAVKEVHEEAGLIVRPTRLLALWERDRQGMPPHRHAIYKVCFQCQATGGHLRAGAETSAAEWFAEDTLPPLSLSRNSPEQLLRLLALSADPRARPEFD